tara:strand:- start:7231 stop:7422 length:192 start_codon:yes stop_codon:yes gene_type:complete
MYTVIEGIHKDPNNIKTMKKTTKKIHGPFKNKKKADALAMALIQKNIDDFYHRAWVIKKNSTT